MLEEYWQHQGQPQCILQPLLPICKPSDLVCRFAPNPSSQDHWHRMFGRFVQAANNGRNPTGGGG